MDEPKRYWRVLRSDGWAFEVAVWRLPDEPGKPEAWRAYRVGHENLLTTYETEFAAVLELALICCGHPNQVRARVLEMRPVGA